MQWKKAVSRKLLDKHRSLVPLPAEKTILEALNFSGSPIPPARAAAGQGKIFL
jgi:hypothetical protein